MSSTNRGGERSPADNYPSPRWTVRRIIERLSLPKDCIWYEPCGGDGAVIETVGREIDWCANDTRDESVAMLRAAVGPENVTQGDILTLDPAIMPDPDRVGVVMTNPPYRIAFFLLQRMLAVYPKAHIVLLLRLNFVASEKRHDFMTKFAPDLYVLPNRPGFKKWGKTDSPEYAWFHWGPAPRARKEGRYQLLDLTSLDERKKG